MFLIEPKFNDAMINHDFKSLSHRLIPWNPGNQKKRGCQHYLINVSNSQITAKLSIKQTFVNLYISDNCIPT